MTQANTNQIRMSDLNINATELIYNLLWDVAAAKGIYKNTKA